jgi:quercetin dioxygenase-like cupin family protein
MSRHLVLAVVVAVLAGVLGACRSHAGLGAVGDAARHAAGDSATGTVAVPVYEEPRHRPVYQNRYVRVLDVRVPVGDTTGYHVHPDRNVGVVIAGARTWSQSPGEPASPPAPADSVGTVFENWKRPLPYTHRVGNADTVAFHYVVGDLLAPAAIDAPPLPETSAMRLVAEGPLARVYRVVLAPGARAEVHTHAAPGLTVQVSAEAPEDEGGPPAAHGGSGAGAWRWRDAGYRHALRNASAAPVTVVEIDWR